MSIKDKKDADLLLMVDRLDRLAAIERAAWSARDSDQLAATLVGRRVAAASRPDGMSGPVGVIARIGWGWLGGGFGLAAAVLLVVGIAWRFGSPPQGASQPDGRLAWSGEFTIDRGDPLDERLIESELSAWLSSTVGLDALALLSATQETGIHDSLEHLESDLASFWTIRSEWGGFDDSISGTSGTEGML